MARPVAACPRWVIVAVEPRMDLTFPRMEWLSGREKGRKRALCWVCGCVDAVEKAGRGRVWKPC